MTLIELFFSFCLIGVLAFGGGYAVLPLIQEQCVEIHGWISMAEFSDLVTISQITPGPIAINSATFVGMKVAGIGGAVVASVGFMIPPFIIVTILFAIYRKYGNQKIIKNILEGLKPAVVGLIAVAAVNVILEAVWGEAEVSIFSADVLTAVITLGAFFFLRKLKTGVIATILTCGAISVFFEIVMSYFA